MKTFQNYDSVFLNMRKKHTILLRTIILNHPVEIWKDKICHLSGSNKMNLPISIRLCIVGIKKFTNFLVAKSGLKIHISLRFGPKLCFF